MLDAVVDYLPSPLDIPPVKGVDPDTEQLRRSGQRKMTRRFPPSRFKIMTDPFVGR